MKRYTRTDYRNFILKLREDPRHSWVNAHASFPERTVKALETQLSDAARRLGYRTPRLVHKNFTTNRMEIWTRYIGLIPTARRIKRSSHDRRGRRVCG